METAGIERLRNALSGTVRRLGTSSGLASCSHTYAGRSRGRAIANGHPTGFDRLLLLVGLGLGLLDLGVATQLHLVLASSVRGRAWHKQ